KEDVRENYIAVIKNPRYENAPEYINPETRQKFLSDNGIVFLRPYQINAIKAIQKSVQNGNQRFLLEMATGERVIIVMGAVFIMKSRVSGTLTKYISCIA
ncbi:MAG: hypothetical protein PHY30_03375, partial [Candidatus Pacebacteria bacterium]|nr:hypothetical protein [Candidatus Paceibacterota bacterium]